MSPLSLTRHGHSHTPDKHHLLHIRNLHVHYGSICALKNVHFEIGCGHCVGLLGPNGAGKSTLVKTLAGLNQRIEGEVTWSGKPVAEMRKEIAYLPQVEELDRYFPLTVRGLVELGRYPHLGSRKAWTKEDSQVVEASLETLRLEDLRDRRLYQLSGGQLQRAQLARALAQEAHVLLLVCHHDLKVVPDLFDHVLLLNREQIAFGETREIFIPEHLERTFPEQRDREGDDV
jgi:ABC-type Mn2+/Zn2+ transport system ATPase subunit